MPYYGRSPVQRCGFKVCVVTREPRTVHILYSVYNVAKGVKPALWKLPDVPKWPENHVRKPYVPRFKVNPSIMVTQAQEHVRKGFIPRLEFFLCFLYLICRGQSVGVMVEIESAGVIVNKIADMYNCPAFNAVFYL